MNSSKKWICIVRASHDRTHVGSQFPGGNLGR